KAPTESTPVSQYRAGARVELTGVLSVGALDLGQNLPAAPKDNTPKQGLAQVDRGFIWERRTTGRHYFDGEVRARDRQTNAPDDSQLTTPVGQDVTPDKDKDNRLVVVDNDRPDVAVSPAAGDQAATNEDVLR